MMGMGGIAHTLDGVATLTAALESSEIEILDVDVRTSGQTTAGDGTVIVSLRLPDGSDGSDHTGGDGDSNVFYLEIRPSDVEGPTSILPRSGSISRDADGSTDAAEPADARGPGPDGDGNAGADASDARTDAEATTDTAGPEGAASDGDSARTNASAGGSADHDASSDAGTTATEGDSGGMVRCRNDDCEETFETERGMKIHFTKTHLEGAGTDDDADDDRPAYANPAKLRRVYEKHDTFEEMTEALDVEVSPATVRRHMIKYGIYDPAADAADGDRSGTSTSGTPDRRSSGRRPDDRYRTAVAGGGPADDPGQDPDDAGRDHDDDADPVESIRELLARRDDSRVPLPDDDELPDGITVPNVVDAVVASRTVHQVATHLETNRETAREVLERADLLDLVEGRLDAETSREERERKVAARIEAMARPQASPQP
jgi:hypothetical protein